MNDASDRAPLQQPAPIQAPFAQHGRGATSSVPCPYCATPFSDKLSLQGHLAASHGHKPKKPKKVKLVKAKYQPASYNPANGFLPAVGIGILVACLIAVIAPGSMRYAVPAGSLAILAAKYGLFNR